MKDLLITTIRLLSDDDGQGLMEYGLVTILIAIVAISALQSLGIEIFNLLDSVIPLPGP
ncbi:MAG: Flp family type IVb pilin [Acidobacteriota bacterium]|nr:Flp family type IVb pilin [Blastocatellia bacterium]MDW8239135.1 Flp family type IVb pilin [Acidobacteriota bacterium]